MTALLKKPITLAWAALVAMTCLSWESARGIPLFDQLGGGSVFVLVLALFKVRLIMMWFMELREAPRPLRLFAEAYPVAVLLSLVVIYWYW